MAKLLILCFDCWPVVARKGAKGMECACVLFGLREGGRQRPTVLCVSYKLTFSLIVLSRPGYMNGWVGRLRATDKMIVNGLIVFCHFSLEEMLR